VADAILQKEGKLNEVEYEEMKQHPIVASHLLESNTFLSQYRKAIESHHERYDGSGYPFGLAGEDIPIEGRIIAIADTFDALTSHRPYRKAISSEKAIQIIEEQSNQQFDPAIVDVFVKLWWQHHFRRIILHSAPGIPLASCPVHGEIIEITAAAKPKDQASCPACKASFQLVLQEGIWLTINK
jgi:HD-GYP domain-containing protein (c-di-GMP phosphodiesterase class II)